MSRERGTPRNALPYHGPIIIIGLSNLLCACLATSLFVYSSFTNSHHLPIQQQQGESGCAAASMTYSYYYDCAKLIFVALLGTTSTTIGIIYSDSTSHAISFVMSIMILQIVTLSEERNSSHDGSIISFSSGNVIAASLILAAASSPPFLFAILKSMRGGGMAEVMVCSLLRLINYSTNNINNNMMLLRPMTTLLQSVCIIPLLLSIHQSIMIITTTTTIIESSNKNDDNYFSTIPIHFIYIITIILLHMYYTNRSHKYGCLLTNNMIIQSLLSGLIMLLSIYYIVVSNMVSNMPIVLFLLGSTIMILFVTIYASIADVWYSVGSGQFSMISLDTSGLLIFVLCPSVILALRFTDMYNDTLHNIRNVLLDRYIYYFVNNIVVIIGIDDISRDTTATTTETSPSLILIIIMLTMTTIIGVSLINALCPLGGYLYSRAYIHGQPNTKKVALCINYCDLPKKKRKNDNDDDDATHMSGDVRDEIWKTLQTREQKTTSSGDNNATTTTTAVLNIFVTCKDMALYSKEIIKIANHGHAIELTLTDDTLLSKSGIHGHIHQFFVYSTPTIRGGKSACAELQLAHREYTKLFVNETTVMKKKPTWFLSMSSLGRHPMVLRMANDLGMKVTYWSAIICLTTDDNRGGLFSIEQKIELQNDVLNKNGGNIIYITAGDRQGDITNDTGYNDRATEAICELIESIDDTFSLETLSNVAKDDAIMALNNTN